LLDLASNRFGEAGDALLILRPKVFGGPTKCIGEVPELVGELTLALTET